MRFAIWMKLPWYLKLATLIASVFFNQRFDNVGHNEITDGVWVEQRDGRTRIVGSDE